VTGDILSNGKTIAFQYCAKPMAPDSRAEVWHGAEFITLRGNSAFEIRDYYQLRAEGSRGQGGEGGVRYVKSGLRAEAMAQLLEALEHLMLEKQLYLDPDLSLPKLADCLNTTVNHVSQTINAGLQTTFFDYINQKRVEAAIKLDAVRYKIPRGDPRYCFGGGLQLHLHFLQRLSQSHGSDARLISAAGQACGLRGSERPEVPSVIEIWHLGVIGVAFALSDGGVNPSEFVTEVAWENLAGGEQFNRFINTCWQCGVIFREISISRHRFTGIDSLVAVHDEYPPRLRRARDTDWLLHPLRGAQCGGCAL